MHFRKGSHGAVNLKDDDKAIGKHGHTANLELTAVHDLGFRAYFYTTFLL
jgi:hypothetical protein